MMHQQVSTIIAWLLWATAEGSKVCSYVEVVNAQYQTSRNGRYKLMDQECNGKPVYAKDTGFNYIFFLELDDGWKGWMIGSTFCYNRGGMAVEDNAAVPYEVSTPWEEVYADRWWVTNTAVECTGPLTTGAMIGVVLGVVFVVIAIIMIILCCCKGQVKKANVRNTSLNSGGRRRRSQIATVSRPRATVRPVPPNHPIESGMTTDNPAFSITDPPSGLPVAPPAYSAQDMYPPPYPALPDNQGPPPSYSEVQHNAPYTVHNPSAGNDTCT